MYCEAANKSLSRRLALGLLLLSPLAAATAEESATSWPGKPVRLVVNFAPGGAVDVVGRAVSAALLPRVGQPVVVENRAGAGGGIGAENVAKSAPDGYTLLVSAGTLFSIGPFVYDKMPVDPFKDLVPVAPVSRGIQYLLVRSSLPVKDAREFLDYVKKNSGAMTYGSAGNGSGPHLAGEMFKAKTGTSALHVPYKGAAPALQDLLAGRLDYVFDPGIGLSQLAGGKIRLLAIGGDKRVSRFPDVPTLDELGVKDFNAESLFGVFAPAGTPAALVKKINAEIGKALENESLRSAILANGAEVAAPMSAESFLKALRQEAGRFGPIAKERGIRAD
ncbi:Tripartite tricarboxylate transporter family receptor [Pigmentiphaga humi]|uniref:Tripartite tricarboxylate transporter family receptor n=1 Tax=Pigmentiphaga humi TaxID=2478468 RepID=A0A3P4AX47_9BURK|nr:tripartite tricarboxylate transporter substrate binding protein [Pigmentiphaga humi]VCU67966.1 Tripartite tricarboxylate transporter family receptor [Pigmentiphaga humi]